jgi:hypothetical protein
MPYSGMASETSSGSFAPESGAQDDNLKRFTLIRVHRSSANLRRRLCPRAAALGTTRVGLENEDVNRAKYALAFYQSIGEQVGFHGQVVGAEEVAIGGGGAGLRHVVADLLHHGALVIIQRAADALQGAIG